MEVADPFLFVDFKEALFISRFDQVSVVIGQCGQGREELQDSDLVTDVGDVEVEGGHLLLVPACQTHVGFRPRLVLDFSGLCFVRASPLPAPLRVAIDLAFVASFWRKGVVVHFTADWWVWASAAHAHPGHTVPLSYPEVAGGTATQVAALGVGAAVAAGCLRGATLVDVLAAATELLVLEAGWTHALVAPQGVVAGGSSADVCAETLVLIDALVPLVVLQVTLRAAAPVAPDDVLAAMLAAVVAFALIHIFTAGPALVQGESPLAFTGEAPRRVLADALGATQVDIRGTLIVVDAGCVVLGEPRRAFAREATNGVHTQELAVVLLGCTLIEIFAASPVLLQNVAFRAGTLVTPLCVFADKIAGFGSLVTLIEIHTGSPSYIWSVAGFTVAMIGASVIDTFPVSANIMNNLAFINICSIGHKPSAMRAELLESHGALERADLTEGSPASPSITAAFGLGDRIPVAGANLTQVLQHLREAIPFPAVQTLVLGRAGREAVVTLARVAPACVEAAAVLADSWPGLTLILVHAAFPIGPPLVAGTADAHVGADEVLALHLLLRAVVLALLALVLVFAHPPVFSQHIPSRTFALI